MNATQQRGATLIEVLVAMVILAIGLLGLAGLQSVSVQSNQGAYYRSQATILANDMADRMRANRTAALAGSYALTTFPAPSTSNAITGTPAQRDTGQWLNNLAATLPQGTGTIVTSGKIVTLTICWNDSRARIKSTQYVAPQNDSCTSTAENSGFEVFSYRTRL